MKALLIGMDFYDYEKKIAEEMRKNGYQVDYMSDTSPKNNMIKRILGNKAAVWANARYQKRQLERCAAGYDMILVIVGRALTVDFIRNLRKENPKSRMVLYLWDDVARVENFRNVSKYYDRIYSFDPVDCEREGFYHLPLFYTATGNYYENKKESDIYSAMFCHSDRLALIRKIMGQAIEEKRKCVFFVCLGRFGYFLYRCKNLRKPVKDSVFYTDRPIDKMRNYEYMKRAKAILDIQFSSQIGLTMRTIESLGLGVKLITTNESIRKYDFYNERNIQIIDRKDPVIDWHFLDIGYEKIRPEIYEKYSLERWVNVILSGKEEKYMS